MRSLIMFSAVSLFVIAMDLYAFRGILHLTGLTVKGRSAFPVIYWALTLLMLGALVWTGTRFRSMRDPAQFFGISLVIGIFLMLYLPKLVFNAAQLVSDLGDLLLRLAGGQLPLLRKGLLAAGAVLGGILLAGFAYGMIWGRNHLKVVREEIPMERLSPALDGLRVVQISDFHLAGFYHHPEQVRRVIDSVNALEPDLLLFTGDMVHNFSEELDPFVADLQRLEAPLGKYAVLGNHDYGKYFDWSTPAEESANLERVKAKIRESGFDLLLNEHRRVSVDGGALQIIGVENWGKPPFPQEGDLEAALEGTDPGLPGILLSHDPSHWDLKVRGKVPVDLTLSGHTHGMQVGLEIGDFRWSPSRWTYRQWAGRYSDEWQQLYVNRGIGFTGFPGRVGIRPEITLLTLRSVPAPSGR